MILVQNRLANFILLGCLVSAAVLLAGTNFTGASTSLATPPSTKQIVLSRNPKTTTSQPNYSTSTSSSSVAVSLPSTTPMMATAQAGDAANATVAEPSSSENTQLPTPTSTQDKTLPASPPISQPNDCAICDSGSTSKIPSSYAARHMCPMYCME